MLVFLLAPQLLAGFGMSHYYLPLFYIDVVGVSIQVVFMALLNVFFYLDRRDTVLMLCTLFLGLNLALTLLSIELGPSFFGYGFTVSLACCVLLVCTPGPGAGRPGIRHLHAPALKAAGTGRTV